MKRVGPVCEASSGSKSWHSLSVEECGQREATGCWPVGRVGAGAQGSSETKSAFPFCHHQDVHTNHIPRYCLWVCRQILI